MQFAATRLFLMKPTERRKAFIFPDLARVDFGQLPERFEFVPKTLVVFSERIGLYVSDRKGFGVSLHSPESLRSKAGLCFVSGQIRPNLTKAFERVRQMLQHQVTTIPAVTTVFDNSFVSVSDVNDTTQIAEDTIIHDGHIAIKITTIGVQSIFVLDGFETGFGCVPIGHSVEKKQWAAIFNNLSSTWESLTK
jgi:hypothetical protein